MSSLSGGGYTSGGVPEATIRMFSSDAFDAYSTGIMPK